MKFENENWGGAKFNTPEKPNVFQIVAYDSVRFDAYGAPPLLVLWEMAKALIEDWECEALPDPQADLKAVTDARAARVIEWAGIQVSAWRRSLDEIPKN